MEKITFKNDRPVEVALAYLAGKPCTSQFNGNQLMFSTIDGKHFWLSQAAGEIIEKRIKELGIRVGEPIKVAKESEPDGGYRWMVYRTGEKLGSQPDGTFVVPKASAAPIPVPKAAPPAQPPGNPPAQLHQGWSQFLLLQTNALIDVYFAALSYANDKYGNAVQANTVQSLVLTAFINLTRRTSCDIV